MCMYTTSCVCTRYPMYDDADCYDRHLENPSSHCHRVSFLLGIVKRLKWSFVKAITSQVFM